MPGLRAARITQPGHFGEFLQGRLGPDGPLALVTLPCPLVCVSASLRPARDLSVWSAQRLLPRPVARAFLHRLGAAPRGRIALRAHLPPGGGAGVSTAALLALARLAAPWATPEALATACLEAEGASDPLMYPAPGRLLWAPRGAERLGTLPPPPTFEVIGGFHGPVQRTEPGDTAFPDIADLVADWDKAGCGRAALARLASESARRTIALRRGGADPLGGLVAPLGAMGRVIGHTGNAHGLLYAPGTVPPGAVAALRTAGLRRIVQFRSRA